MMQRTTVTVAYVNPPKGNGPGNIKTNEGIYYQVWTKKTPLSNFQAGGTYTIDYETVEYNGKPQYTVAAVLPPAGAPLMQTGSHAPKANGSGAYRETSQRDAERMFVCSLANAFISAGHIQPNATDLKQAIDILRVVWRGTFGQDQ